MNVVWKYAVDLADGVQTIPAGAPVTRLLRAGLDPQGQLCVWAMVEDDAFGGHDLLVQVVGTGHRLDTAWSPSEYLGSANQGRFVWHVFASVSP